MKQEEFLKIYEKYSDEDLNYCVVNGINLYNVIKKSEMVAEKLLAAHGIKYYYLHEDLKYNLKELFLCAKMRGISLPKKVYYDDITMEDVIERIRENESYQEGIFMNDFENISKLYDDIVLECEKIMRDGKKLNNHN